VTEWTPEEEAVARALCETRYWEGGWPPADGRVRGELLIEARAAIAAMQPRWRDVRTDPPPRDGTSILAWIDGFGMGPMVLFWMDRYWREPANHLGLKKEPSFWQPITPPLPTAPEDRT